MYWGLDATNTPSDPQFSSGATRAKTIRDRARDAGRTILPVSFLEGSRKAKGKRKSSCREPAHPTPLTWSNRKAELVRENASLYEQLNNHNNSNNNHPSSQTEIPATTWASPQSAKPAPSLTQLQQQSVAQTTGHDGQISEISSHAGVPGSVPPVDILPDVPVGSHGFQVAPATLEIGQIGRDKIHHCFALYVSFLSRLPPS